MTYTSADIQAAMSDFQFEPTRVISVITGLTEQLFGGKTLMVDPSNPFVQLIESQVMLTAAAVEENRILNNRQYASMAQDDESLFYHLSDKDYEGMFGTPSGTIFDIYLSKDELIANAVQVGDTGTKRITIPKHSRIVVNNLAFTFQYPINFIIKKHGGIDVVYDGSQPSPLQQLSGNKVDWGTFTNNIITDNNVGRTELIRVRTFLKQMMLTSYTYSLSAAKSLKKILTLTDQFYYCRAFSQMPGKDWVEIKTTHSQQVFDPMDPTLLLKVVADQLTVELPYVYYATSLVRGAIRVDVYTTKGPVTMALNDLDPSAFVAEWRDLDNSDNKIYSAPLSVMSSISILSTESISGGTNAPSFETRRSRVLNNAVGDSVLPISDAQMGTTLSELGFDSMVVNDDVTTRTYLATRAMPSNDNGRASTGIDAAVLTAKYAIEDIVNLKTVITNGDHYTITPKTLYQNLDGILKIVSDEDKAALELLKGDALVNKISGGSYLYTPLHYVLDIATDEFEARPYFLSSPSFDITSFVASNDTLGLSIGSSSTRSIVQDDAGYLLTIQSSSNATWKALDDTQVHVQLAYKPAGESDFAYINGVQVAKPGERIFQFRIASNWDLSRTHDLTTTNFAMYEPVERDYPTPLLNTFSLIWSVSDFTVDGIEKTAVDQVIGKFLLPENAIGVYHEEVEIRLGDELSGLWARARSMVGIRKYLTYQTDVYAFWKTNVYAKDANNRPIIKYVNGVAVGLEIQYAKGDPVLDGDGNHKIEHYKGDAIIDENGNAELESERNVIRWWDMCLFDAVYRYASYAADKDYVASVPEILVTWINETLGTVRADCLEQTDLLFQPRNTIKFVQCLVDDSELKSLLTSQKLTVNLFVSNDVYKNLTLRAALKATAIAQIVLGLDSDEIARDALMDEIRNNLGADVIGIKLTGLGGEANDFDVITLVDKSARLCVAKSLEAQADGTYAVVDAIEVNFKKHANL